MKQIHIGQIIRQRRIELNMTQEELCAGICETATMSRIENGKQTPTPGKLKALLSRLGLPSEKYYAMMSENELEIERLKNEIIDCNTRGLCQEGLEKIQKLLTLTDDSDFITHQFILRSKVLLGKEENGSIVPYSMEEKLELLFRAIKITVPDFDIDEIGRQWYSLDEIKIINQIGVVYGDNQQERKALDIYYQLMKYVKKRHFINSDTVPTAILLAQNYSLYLCVQKRYEEAIEIAEWGWNKSVEWGRATSLGGLMFVLGESLYHLGQIKESKEYYLKAYYAFSLMKNTQNMNIVQENIKEYFNINI
ncbi:MAG: helix-turn-helix domain-containing protein [Negativibacillus sp.]